MRRFLFGLLLCSAFVFSAQGQTMNNERLGKILHSVSDSLEGEAGNWQFFIQGQIMICLTDEGFNRMRIISPVVMIEEVSPDELMACMEANFHTALDVKYAVSEGILWSVFIHPLKELTRAQAIDAVQQVYNAVATFGTSYNSTHLVFPKREPEEPPGKKLPKKS
ncbi:MAG: hypothetical protein KDC44_19865 [Phaeodactylibacter sp.]|nr:hypothetical protein [Phaeodactylibacter sp.]